MGSLSSFALPLCDILAWSDALRFGSIHSGRADKHGRGVGKRASRRSGRRANWRLPIEVSQLETRLLLATLTVNTNADNTTSDSTLTLREAVALVNAGGNAATALGRSLTAGEAAQVNTSSAYGVNDTINFASSLDGYMIMLTGGQLSLTATTGITVTGPGADRLQIFGGWNGSTGSTVGSRIFLVNSGVTASISGLTLRRGNAGIAGSGAGGGAVRNHGTLTLDRMDLSESQANFGGGIYNSPTGNLTIRDSVLHWNLVTATNVSGGGLANDGTALLVNTTVANNTSAGEGGGLANAGTLNIVHGSIIRNTAATSAGGVYRGGGTVSLRNTLVVGNTAAGAPSETSGTITNAGGNLLAIPGGQTLSNIVNTGLLTTDGGTTRAARLVTGSAALNAGVAVASLASALTSSATSASVNSAQYIAVGSLLRIGSEILRVSAISGTTLTVLRGQNGTTAAAQANGAAVNYAFDQRGNPFVRNSGGVDIGAYELQSAPIPLVVDTTADIDNGDYSAGNFSLREAIKLAENPGADTITFASRLNGQTITLNGVAPLWLRDTTGATTITGPGADLLTINGGWNGVADSTVGSRIFDVNSEVTASISGLTLRRGNAGGSAGGAIRNQGTLSLDRMVLSESQARIGGGVYNAGNLTIRDSTLHSNRVTTSFGGGLDNDGTALLVNTTVANNTSASGAAGGLSSFGTLNIVHGSIIGNTAATVAGGVYRGGGTVHLRNTLVVGNTVAGAPSETSGTITNDGGNLLAIPGGQTLGNIVHTSGGTAVLTTDGGTTRVARLVTGSPALNTGVAVATLSAPLTSSATSASVNSAQYIAVGSLLRIGSEILRVSAISGTTLTVLRGQNGTTAAAQSSGAAVNYAFDQRGNPFVRNSGGVDIGAYELQATPIPLVVDTAADVDDGVYSTGNFSLREAVRLAHSPGADTITFASSLNGQTITLSGGQLTLADTTGATTITGPGANLLTISGGWDGVAGSTVGSRIFFVNSEVTASASISGLTLRRGNSSFGGAVWNGGTLALDRMDLSESQASFGGGILNFSAANLTIRDSTVHSNRAAGSGGGLYIGGTVLLVNTTVALNTSAGEGGGLANAGTLNIVHGSIIGNTAATAAGGVYRGGGTVHLRNTLVVGNTVAGAPSETSGTITNDGGNLLAIPGGQTLGNIVTVNSSGVPILTDHGGPTPTVAIIPGGPAAGIGVALTTLAAALNNSATSVSVSSAQYIAVGSLLRIGSEILRVSAISGTTLTVLRGQNGTTAAAQANGAAVNYAFDQRGNPFVRNSGGVDIGAYELQSAPIPLVVDTTADIDNGDYSTGNFSLREAVRLAHNPGADTITFATSLNGQTITLTGVAPLWLIDTTGATTITGPGADLLTINGGWDGVADSTVGSRIFFVNTGVTAGISGLTLRRGNAGGAGSGAAAGAVGNGGTLTLDRMVLSQSQAGFGGGIYNSSTGNLTIRDSTLHSNRASVSGGGLDNDGTALLVNTTVALNTAANSAGGLANSSTLNVVHGSIIGNTAATSAGGVFRFGGTVRLRNTLVVGNTAAGAPSETSSTITNDGGNLLAIPSGQTLGQIVTVNSSGVPILTDHGGPTHTVAIIPGGPAAGIGVALTTLAAALNNSATSVSVAAATYIGPGSLIQVGSEIIRVVSVSGTTLTVLRGQNGTTAAAHANAASIYMPVDQRGFPRLYAPGRTDAGAYEVRLITGGNPGIDGDWFAPAGITGGISQIGNQLWLTNRSGVVATAYFTSPSTILIPTWGTAVNVTGVLNPASNVLTFSNGTVWTRAPALGGAWVIGNTITGTGIRQLGTTLTFTDQSGNKSGGTLLSPTLVQAANLYGVTNLQGTLSSDQQRITFTNGTIWTRLPRVGGTWVASTGGSEPTRIDQAGQTLLFTNRFGETSIGRFTAFNQVEATEWLNGAVPLVGTLTATGLNWANGTSWVTAPMDPGQRDISGFYNDGVRDTRIISGRVGVTFVKEPGNRSVARGFGSVLPGNTQAQSGFADLGIGTFTATGITWANGVIWTKYVDIGGAYGVGPGGTAGVSVPSSTTRLEAGITQVGKTLRVTNEAGVSVAGAMTGTSTISVPTSGLTGTIANGVISWSNGTTWFAAPNIAGYYGPAGTITTLGTTVAAPLRVQQVGLDVIYSHLGNLLGTGRFNSRFSLPGTLQSTFGGAYGNIASTFNAGFTNFTLQPATVLPRLAPLNTDLVFANRNLWPFL